ncbi:MAG: MFS transporter [Bowdeniella nasicola]|nr:MFS transporter [Bowdeniella nasicola]
MRHNTPDSEPTPEPGRRDTPETSLTPALPPDDGAGRGGDGAADAGLKAHREQPPLTGPSGEGHRIFSVPVLSWALWDWGSAAFNAVITTFVFSVYLTTAPGFQAGPGQASPETLLGTAMTIAGLAIALFAPVNGQRSDKRGTRGTWLMVNTLLVVAVAASLFFITPEREMLWIALVLLGVGNIVFEFASVNYNAILNDISTPSNIGRISGFGWGMGYLGGIVLLLFVYYAFISPEVGLFGVSDANGLDVRVTMLVCAAWTLIFSIPVFITALRAQRQRVKQDVERRSYLESYRELFALVGRLWRTSRHTVYFLMASAVFRDGLAGVFTFGGVIAAKVFGFSSGDVIVFAVAANVVAGIATIASGRLDDIFGPKRVIVFSLVAMIISGFLVFLTRDGSATMFWIFGLTLCVFVGPAQSASRTFLARIIPAGREGEVFGLYATTGRVVSFMAPAAFTAAVALAEIGQGVGNGTPYGILGIILVLIIGLGMLLPVRPTQSRYH